MGYQDRDYYREEDDQPKGFQLTGQRSMVVNLILLNVLIFVTDAFGPVSTWEVKLNGRQVVVPDGSPEALQTADKSVSSRWLSERMSLPTEVFSSPRDFLAHSWQLLTCGFAHAPLGSGRQFLHIGMNMFTLWMFGREVEGKYGKWEFLRFYLAAIMAASLVWAAVHHFLYAGPASSYGASGAVTAVVILFVLNFPTRTLYLFGVVAVPAWAIGVLFIALDVLGSIGQWDNVAYEAHLAGAAFAVAYRWSGLNFGRFWPSRWKISPSLLKPKPQLKVHDPDPEESYRDLDEQADEILAKLHREGENSLSRQERRILEDYSRRMRQKHR